MYTQPAYTVWLTWCSHCEPMGWCVHELMHCGWWQRRGSCRQRSEAKINNVFVEIIHFVLLSEIYLLDVSNGARGRWWLQLANLLNVILCIIIHVIMSSFTAMLTASTTKSTAISLCKHCSWLCKPTLASKHDCSNACALIVIAM